MILSHLLVGFIIVSVVFLTPKPPSPPRVSGRRTKRGRRYQGGGGGIHKDTLLGVLRVGLFSSNVLSRIESHQHALHSPILLRRYEKNANKNNERRAEYAETDEQDGSSGLERVATSPLFLMFTCCRGVTHQHALNSTPVSRRQKKTDANNTQETQHRERRTDRRGANRNPPPTRVASKDLLG